MIDKIKLFSDVGKNSDPCFDHVGQNMKIDIHLNCFLKIRASHFKESLIIHRLEVFAVHPFELFDIKDGR